jgi:hypothetical protein
MCNQVCGRASDVWICLICGHLGCGRYHAKHAVDHWKETSHCYALEIQTQRVRCARICFPAAHGCWFILRFLHCILHHRTAYLLSVRRKRLYCKVARSLREALSASQRLADAVYPSRHSAS